MPRRLIRAWITFFGPQADALSSEASSSLAMAGIELTPMRRERAAGPGLLFVDSPSPDACELVRRTSVNGAERVVVVLPSAGTLGSASVWPLAAAGACDVVAWDGSQTTSADIAARFERWCAVDDLLESPRVRTTLVGESAVWKRCLRELVDVARFTDSSVLLMGESGTGKELAARLIHDLDSRTGKRDLVLLDCATIVPSLSGSEFFGHERGAFTGAVTAREGAFARADGGTLFLDEVGELPPGLQAELLRVVQEGTYKRVGSDTWRQTRFRLICATNRDVSDDDGTDFRRDLYYRVAGSKFQLPSLRERCEDISALVAHFLSEARPNEPMLQVDEPVRQLLLTRDYPGNVRDLRHLVLRIAARHVGPGPITIGDVPAEERPASEPPKFWRDPAFDSTIGRAVGSGATLREITTAAAEAAIVFAVDEAGGNLRRAAERLRVTTRALQLRRAGGLGAVGDGPGSA
jgi:transcriptional regulator with GAF, ATPase, and Fis domain